MHPYNWKWKHTAAVVLFCGMALACFGCGTAGGKALAACELGKLPQVVEPVIADVTAIAVSGGADWQTELTALGTSLAPGQLECVVQAIVAAWSAGHAQLAPDRVAALGRLGMWLQAHPAKACADRSRG